MTEEQIKQKFKETYPDFMRGNEPLSPYFDIWEYGIEIATNELQDENLELEAKVRTLEIEQHYCLPNCSKIADLEKQNKELQKENERLAKHILELQRDKGRLADENKRISIQYAEETDETIKELEKQIEKMKSCFNCKYCYNCPHCKDDFYDCKN